MILYMMMRMIAAMAITTPYLCAVKPGKYKTKSSKIIFEDYTHDPDQGVPLPKDDAPSPFYFDFYSLKPL